MSTTIYAWTVQRGESAGLTVPVLDRRGDPVDPTDPQPWATTAVVRPEPGDARVLHDFADAPAFEVTPSGVRLHLTAQQTRDAAWRRGWWEVVLTDPTDTDEVSMIVHGPLSLTP